MPDPGSNGTFVSRRTIAVSAAAIQALGPAPADQAQIVFMRSTFVARALRASVFDVTTEEPVFVGDVPNGARFVHRVAPGEHLFMFFGYESADFLRAEVEAGRTYWVMVTPFPGVITYRFSFRPIRGEATGPFSVHSADFAEWVGATEIVENTPESLDWSDAEMAKVARMRARFWPEWSGKPARQRDSQTLRVGDGQLGEPGPLWVPADG